MTQIVLIHGGESTRPKLEAALPGARVAIVYRPGLSAAYNEVTGVAHDFPTLEELLSEFAPDWSPGEPLVVLGFSAGGWALRYYLRDPAARAAISAAIFLDSLYSSGSTCDLSPYQGVLAFADMANADPAHHRLIMSYSQATPTPGICSEAIESQKAGPGVFVRGYPNGDHSAQQGVAGPEVIRDWVAPWIGGAGGAGAGIGWLAGLSLVAGAMLLAWRLAR